MGNLLFSISAVMPIFIVILLGVFLKKIGIINDGFVSVSTKVVFNVALPAMIFRDLVKSDFGKVVNINMIVFVVASTLIIFFASYLLCRKLIADSRTQGAFVQGVFRSNYAIIGLQLASTLFGDVGVAKGALLLAVIMPLYNILAVIVLSATSPKGSGGYGGVLLSIAKNPLILSVVLALPFSYLHIHIPDVFAKSIDYLASIALPLALIGIGGVFNFAMIRSKIVTAMVATSIKILAVPGIFIPVAVLAGFRKEELGVMFLLLAAPTAVASFIMAKAMDSDSELAVNIVMLTTLGSAFTLSAGIFILRTAKLI